MKFRKIILLAISALVSFQIMFFTLRNPGASFEGNLRNIAIFFCRGGIFLERIVQEKIREFGNKRKLIQENERLKDHLSILASENALLREELEKLRMELEAHQVKEEIGFEVIPAQVIGRDPYDWLGKAMIDRGKNDGIEKDMVVVTYQGMVGKVEIVYDSYSVIRLLLSPSLAVGILVQRTRDLGVAVGDGNGFCIIKYLYRHSKLREGDVVVTSGLGPRTPRGIVVGKIIEIRKQAGSLFQEAILQPNCDFSLLERVLVIKSAT